MRSQLRRLPLLSIAVVAILLAPAFVAWQASADAINPKGTIKFDKPKNSLWFDGNSVGGVKLGAGRKNAVTQLGKPLSTIPGKTGKQFCDIYQGLGLVLCYVRKAGSVPSAVPKPKGTKKSKVKPWNGFVFFISVSNPAFQETSGLGIGTPLAELLKQRPGATELDWGPDAGGNPPQTRALEVNDPDDLGVTHWLLDGADTPEDPSLVVTFNIALHKYASTLYDYLDAQLPHP